MTMNRRTFLAGAMAGTAAAFIADTARAAGGFSDLTVGRRSIEVRGRSAEVFGITDGMGRSGILLDEGRFRVNLINSLDQATTVHWHGQVPPPELDGIADTGYVAPLAPGESRQFDFAARSGTHWMHSHHGLQEQGLLTAPFVVRTPEQSRADAQDVVVMLNDFSFQSGDEIFAALAGGGAMDHGAMAGMGPGDAADAMSMADMATPRAMDLNDVEYDAFLANDRTLDDPEIVRTERSGLVRLRIVNAAASTAFWIDLGEHVGEAVAVDGNDVVPVSGSRFPLAQAQRIDILVRVRSGMTIPVLARREGGTARTGVILAASDASVTKVSPSADDEEIPIDLSLERQLRSVDPLRPTGADRKHSVMLTGSMSPYSWTIDERTWARRKPLEVSTGERVEIGFMNHTMMAHPMHLHGHHFQVVGIDGKRLSGAVRDTVLVPAMSTVTVAFDADNPGRWLYHCHNLYHMASGMMSEVVYV